MISKNANFLKILSLIMTVAVVFSFSSDVFAQKEIQPDLLKTMKWRSIGPFRGGRSVAVTGVVGDRNTYYFGGVGGGVWKTTDGGKDWTPLFDDQPIASIGAIAVAESDNNVIYVGTGEHCPRGNISHGDGVYKSIDAGKSWNKIGLNESRHVAKVLVDPKNSDIVFVSALGHLYAPPGEFRGDHGVFRSEDGGETWTRVLVPDNNVTGAYDLVFDPTNSRIVYATTWEVYRSPSTLMSGGKGSGIYKSTDGGKTFDRITGGGLPEGIWGKVAISVSGANPDVLYSMIEHKTKGGLYRSNDAGANWRLVNSDSNIRQRSWYYSHVYADPKDEDTVYILNVVYWKSTDGGRTLEANNPPHGDNHGMWIDPHDPNRFINANDGGANVTEDGGETWTESKHATAQFYHTFVDDEFPFNVYGAQQDNSTIKITSKSTSGVITEDDWHSVGGGESGHIIPDPRDHNIVYAGSYGGNLTRYDHTLRSSENIQVWPDNPMGWAAGDLKYRFGWTAPIMVSKHNPTELYHASNVLHRSTDEGKNWEDVSKDLTRNDKKNLGASGGPITHDNTSVEYYSTIFAVMESPLKHGLIWVGTDDGLMHITHDNAATWTNVTPKKMPEWSLVSSIEPSHFNEGTAYIAIDRHELDDMGAYAYRTTDYGKSWKLINKGFRANDFLRVVREDPEVEGLLYAGTETGVYYSLDNGDNWNAIQLNLPTSPVHDLQIAQNDLVVGTHGRSFWILDDLTVIHQLMDTKMDKDSFLKSRPSYIGPGGGRGFRGTPKGVGENPPSGSVLNFFINDEVKDEATLEIIGTDGKVISKYSTKDKGRTSLKVEKGMNQFVWNGRYPDATAIVSPMWGGSTRGPAAAPGTYTAKLTNDGKSITTEFEIKIDPRINTTEENLKAQFDFLIEVRDKVSEAHDTVLLMRTIKNDLNSYAKRLKGVAGGEELIKSIKETNTKISEIEGRIIQVKSKSGQDPLNYPIMLNNRLAAVGGAVARSFQAPSKGAKEVFANLKVMLADEIKLFNDIVNGDIAKINNEIKALNIPAIAVKKTGK